MRLHLPTIPLLLNALAATACFDPPVSVVPDDTESTDGTGTTGDLDDGPAEPGLDPICGNGIVEAGETCDDEGESAMCDVDCTPVDCGDGLLNVTAGEQCDAGGESETCDVDCTPVGCGDGLLNVTAGEQCDDDGESSSCDVDCTPVVCGDGLLNVTAGEQCDAGGGSSSCDVDCTPVLCGDGVVNATAGEECDGDGMGTPGETSSCDVDCTAVICGDGQANAAAGEACDDMGESSGCDADCTVVECGDLVVNNTAGETCDDGGSSGSCDPDCTAVTCGDGLVNAAAGEQCDGDGLGTPGETASCDLDCTAVICGDDLANAAAGEQCDDSGASVGCDADCTVAECGDLDLNTVAGEECEGVDLGGQTCLGLGFDVGDLACGGGCSYDTSDCYVLPGAPVLSLSFSQIKQFDFSWAAVAGADYYQLLESASPGDPFVQLGGDIMGQSVSLEMPLHFRYEASYVLRACNAGGCTDSAQVDVVSSLAEAVGYFKASNTSSGDTFGNVALSGDGNTLAVGARYEDGSAIGINGLVDEAAADSGAVYVFVKDAMGTWSQQAYVKASNTDPLDRFGQSVALSEDGNTLAVGAQHEDSNAIGGPSNNNAADSGAAYVFVRNAMGVWSQQAYVKASNTDAGDCFGTSVALSGDGNTFAVSAPFEDGIAVDSGAVYVFVRNGVGAWPQQAYVKASSPGADDRFGVVALSGDGNTLAVGAILEDSNATGVNGLINENAPNAGAVYVFARVAGAWPQQAYVKASNTGTGDYFGTSVALSGNGNTLAVGAYFEDSSATGIDGAELDDTAADAGAVYVFERVAGAWSQQAYVKASNTGTSDLFGTSVALSGDGNVLAVGSRYEDSNATGIDGNQVNDIATNSGAVYVLDRDGMGAWSQRAYVKASNTGPDTFGAVALSGDGNTLAVGAHYEASNATGIGGNQANDAAASAGAVYLY